MIGGSPILGRFEDGALPNLGAREPADPFGGMFGLPERIAAEPGLLLAAHSWSGIGQVLAARLVPPERRFIQPFAAKALTKLGALGGANAALIQAVCFSIDKIQPLPPELEGILGSGGLGPRSGDLAALSRLWAGARGAGKAMLPAYPIVLLLDLQVGKDQLAVMALPYGDNDAAEAAASLLAARLGSWVAEDGATPLIEATGGTIEHRAVLVDAGSPALALVVVRYPMPVDPGAAGRHFGAWLRAIYRRSFLPLAVAD